MRKKIYSGRKFKFVQICDSRQCRKEFNGDIIKNFSEGITTPHEYDGSNKTITCLYCWKISKLK